MVGTATTLEMHPGRKTAELFPIDNLNKIKTEIVLLELIIQQINHIAIFCPSFAKKTSTGIVSSTYWIYIASNSLSFLPGSW